jgi:hypothetical protein
MDCINCGEKTFTDWDGTHLKLCSACSKESIRKDFNRKQEQEKLVNSSEVANTFKFRTIIFILLGLITPLWLITLPLFWYFAYKSYVAGTALYPDRTAGVISKYDELSKLKKLYDSGAITEEEFNLEKQKLLMKTS